MSLQLPPLSLYIHIPWCVRKCPYCDFNSHAARGELPEADYVAALLEDLDTELHDVQGRNIDTIFIGGGTPSLFSATAIQQILAGVAARTPLSAQAEITMEANPGTFEQERFAGFRAAGVNRLSIGIQSFSDAQLKALGRIHNADEAYRAVASARAIGFDNINLDLMHGLPQQDLAGAMLDLDTALSLQPDHLSWYQLTIEPNTEFNARPPNLPVDEVLWEIQEHGQDKLAAAGFAQYEVSAYARDGRKAAHNLNYWAFGDYIGIGAGAHGKLTRPADNRIMRRWKQRQPAAYMDVTKRLGAENAIAQDELAFEFMLNALRLVDGVPLQLLQARAGISPDSIRVQLDRAIQQGLLQDDPAHIRPTHQGRLFLNNLLEMFL
ncbi:radical SAM family heme chaperone HemW [Marinobacterium sedimentorum]|uniref:radical SAM family heme chaperone HemW n=1 Tax=Marinobacterium sedimentorum TaxID=2927804 RepID=UPI0020C70C9D|nr:radical SAM family heme chaperone HemW [Marinobacterium sedimentorum]MCP8686243.1 radical SAM family heme chaperone HemW [Marinobacterium sedimentorum]